MVIVEEETIISSPWFDEHTSASAAERMLAEAEHVWLPAQVITAQQLKELQHMAQKREAAGWLLQVVTDPSSGLPRTRDSLREHQIQKGFLSPQEYELLDQVLTIDESLADLAYRIGLEQKVQKSVEEAQDRLRKNITALAGQYGQIKDNPVVARYIKQMEVEEDKMGASSKNESEIQETIRTQRNHRAEKIKQITASIKQRAADGHLFTHMAEKHTTNAK